MNTLKNIVRAMVILLTTSCVVHAGGPKTSQNITLDDAVSVNGQALKAGDAEVRWTTHSPLTRKESIVGGKGLPPSTAFFRPLSLHPVTHSCRGGSP